jgi:hypothetical protein
MISAMTSSIAGIRRRDIAFAVLVGLIAGADMLSEVYDDAVNASPLAVPFFAALAAPLAWRRVAPLGALLAVLGGLLAHVALFGGVVRCGILFPLILVLAFSAGMRLDARPAVLGLLLVWVIALTVCLSDSDIGAPLGAWPFVAAVAVAVWGAGRLVRSRGRMADELDVRTSELRDVRDDRARLEVATDRARLSADLDELLARRLGELATMADAGAQPSDAATATATLMDIERESRRTLEQMRELVGVLRCDATDAGMAPQPTLTHLEALLVRAKGADARLFVEGNPRVLPAGVELSAYRIVEHLLSALKDAPEVEVRVAFGDDAIELTVSGPARRDSEAAIERARARVQLHRGTLRATTHAGRAEAVASLPILARG